MKQNLTKEPVNACACSGAIALDNNRMDDFPQDGMLPQVKVCSEDDLLLRSNPWVLLFYSIYYFTPRIAFTLIDTPADTKASRHAEGFQVRPNGFLERMSIISIHPQHWKRVGVQF